MASVPARQPPPNQGDAAGACNDSAVSGAGSGSIAVPAVLTANQANADDATQDISAPPAESGGSNYGRAVVSPVQGSQGCDGIDFPSIYLCPFLLDEPFCCRSLLCHSW
jgi:hypothetical protein